jgi:NADH:ubiquinone oxidoreductase subunit F (NADH-binding)
MSAAALAQPRAELPRLLAGLNARRPVVLDEHLSRYGRIDLPRGRLVAELEASGLAGRGGAGFPVARKLRAVAEHRGRPVVVVNAAEGEPLSGKDKVLLRHVPHLVLDGAAALAGELGAREAIVVHAAGARAEGAALAAALADRRARRLDRECKIELVELPDRFVSGQETAVVNYLNGGPALPTFTPPRPFESGVDKRPTLVQNAETAAHVAQIGRFGAAWFRELGTGAEPGSALVTVSGAVGRPGVYEAALGSSLHELIAGAGGPRSTPRAMLVGGYAGGWIDARDAAGLDLTEASLAAAGSTLGVGAIAVLPENGCGLCETARVARFLADQSAGQCGPCVHGLDAIAVALERPQPGRSAGEDAPIARWLAQVAGRGACRHPDGTARFVASALRVFARERRGHDPRRCAAGARPILPLPTRLPR